MPGKIRGPSIAFMTIRRKEGKKNLLSPKDMGSRDCDEFEEEGENKYLWHFRDHWQATATKICRLGKRGKSYP